MRDFAGTVVNDAARYELRGQRTVRKMCDWVMRCCDEYCIYNGRLAI